MHPGTRGALRSPSIRAGNQLLHSKYTNNQKQKNQVRFTVIHVFSLTLEGPAPAFGKHRNRPRARRPSATGDKRNALSLNVSVLGKTKKLTFTLPNMLPNPLKIAELKETQPERQLNITARIPKIEIALLVEV